MRKINTHTKKIFFKYLLIAIPIMIIWILVITLNLYNEKNVAIRSISYEDAVINQNISVLIEHNFLEIAENIKVIKDSNEFIKYIEKNDVHTKEELSQLFERIMSNKENYDQIRFIDTEGIEVIRLNNDEEITVVPDSELQDKSNKDYYNETIGLSEGYIYISPLNLNVDNNKVEIPYNPVVRFATPIYNDYNELQGLLVINYKADYFLELMQNEYHVQSIDSLLYILNKNGEYIAHPNNNNFSFMFNSNNEMNFSDENCYAWEEISGNKSGEIVEAETLITYENVLDIDDNSQFIISDKWIIVRLTDIGHLFSIPALINRIIIPQNITIFAIINLFSFLIAIALVNLKKKDSQLSLTEKLADSTSDAVVITDEYTNILYVNKAFEKATGYLSREVIGKKTNHFKSGKQDKEFYTDMWDSINSKGEWTGLLWDKKRDGLLYPKKLRIYSIFEPATKQVIYYVGMFNDLSSNHNEHQNSVEQQVKIKSHLIPNEELMFELFAQSLNNNEYNFLILYIDIENYNQLFEFVRQESKEIADMFMKLLYPLLSEEDFIAQTGRNLFTAIINIDNITKNIDEYIRELHNSLSSVIETGDQKFFYKTKIGASVSIDSLDAKTILFNAVIALEWALIQNIDYAIYSQDIVLQLNSEHEIESLLRTAIDEDELYMVYQPQIDIRSNKMVGMEALIRWENDKLGFVSPAVFIPLVEKNNLMIEIGDWIIEQVCKDIFKMKELNASIHELVCAINISGIQLLEIDFTKKLLDVMKKYNVDSNKIEIELTESILLTSEKKNINLLKMLRKKGLLIAIDDFGTGYSSISYLNDLPIDKIKIDRCFIQNYPEDDDGKLVKLLINMGHVLGIEILTEGAETSDQIELLRNHGCAYVQGYYYSKPLTMSEFVNYYNNY